MKDEQGRTGTRRELLGKLVDWSFCQKREHLERCFLLVPETSTFDQSDDRGIFISVRFVIFSFFLFFRLICSTMTTAAACLLAHEIQDPKAFNPFHEFFRASSTLACSFAVH